MGTLHPRPLLCERTRGWISFELDGELSELERALMSAHLRRCADCAAFRAEVEGTTTLLRRAPLVPLPRPVALPVRRRAVGAVAMRLGAAAAVVVGGLGLAGGITLDDRRVEDVAAPAGPSLADDTGDRLIRGPLRADLTPRPLLDRGAKVVSLPL